jgi:protein-tyrosine phosphatase
MIDLHLHLLPGIDDGASSLTVTEAMLALAADLGFTRLVATPHLDGPLDPDYQRQAESLTERVRSAGERHGIEVDQGYEIQLDPGLAHRLQAGEPVTLAGSRTVLVEVPFSGWPHHVDQSLFEIQAAGYRPLLAHPERYTAAQADPGKVIDLAERGVMLQVTFSSLTGLFGRSAQQLAQTLVERDLATVLATDAHGAGHRLVNVEKGIERAEELVGPERLDQLVRANPSALLADEPLPEPAPIAPSKSRAGGLKGLASRLRAR